VSQRDRDAGPAGEPGPPPPSTSSRFDLGDKLRQDWEAIKRDVRAGGRELEGAWHRLRELFD
jgi:hypothetical protein